MSAAAPFLEDVRQDIPENIGEFRSFAAENKPPADGQKLMLFNRYYVDVLVDNGAQRRAPSPTRTVQPTGT